MNAVLNDTALTSGDTLELSGIANQNATSDDPGVSFARALLKLDIEDFGSGVPRMEFTKNSENAELAISVYPNPNTGKFFIEYELTEATQPIVIITDILGKIVFSEKLNGNSNILEIQLNFSSGLYILTIQESENIIYSQKVIVTDK